MANVTPGAVIPVNAPYNTNPAYSGTFIPTLWSKKLNAKFYANTMMSELANTSWEGEIASQGDMIRIRTAPSITINDYQGPGSDLGSAEVPTPIFTDMLIDQAKYFNVQVNDVLAHQADMDLMNMFTDDAAKQLKIVIENECFYHWFVTEGANAANIGANAGAISGSYALGTDNAAIAATGNDILNTILRMSAVLDEQNVPESGRWLVLTPQDRNMLMQSHIAATYFSGDQSSTIRTGKIGMLDRFTVYVSNLLPRAAAGTAWNDGLGTRSPGAAAGAVKRHLMVAGTQAACSFASQITKTETLRNQNDFGDRVRGLSVYGRKVLKNTALTSAIIAG
jgi:hypothetical protein